MEVKISDHFTYRKLLKYVYPCIAMMIMTSIYGIVDGFFVSNFIGKNAFSAVNLIMPVLMGIAAFGFMIGTGGSALVAYYLGLKDQNKANQTFSMLIELILIVSVLLSIGCYVYMPQIVDLLGASSAIREDAIIYGRILILAEPFFMLQNSFQSFLATAEKQRFGLYITIIAGITNMVFDFLLMYVFNGGIVGAAMATFFSQVIGGVIPFIYFVRKNNSTLRLTVTKFNLRDILKACGNGASEMLTNLSMSLVSVIYNFQLMKEAAENGIAAYGVVMYVSFIFMAIFIGYSIGINPIIGYNYGAGCKEELHNLLRKSMRITGATSVIMLVSSELFALPIAKIFVGYDIELCEMTRVAFMIYSISYLFCGFNIFASAFFTGLNNGKVSAIISCLRTLVIQIVVVVLLPIWFGIDGIWWAITVAEVVTLVITFIFFEKYKKVYGY